MIIGTLKMPPEYTMEPSSCHSQCAGFNAVIGLGEQSPKVDLGTAFLLCKQFFVLKIPVFADHDFASDIEFFHVISRALGVNFGQHIKNDQSND